MNRSKSSELHGRATKRERCGSERWKKILLAYAMRWKNGFENILGVLGLICLACTKSTSGNMGIRQKNRA